MQQDSTSSVLLLNVSSQNIICNSREHYAIIFINIFVEGGTEYVVVHMYKINQSISIFSLEHVKATMSIFK